jgi:hypothetical protein
MAAERFVSRVVWIDVYLQWQFESHLLPSPVIDTVLRNVKELLSHAKIMHNPNFSEAVPFLGITSI